MPYVLESLDGGGDTELLVNLAFFVGFPTACLQELMFSLNKMICLAREMLACLFFFLSYAVRLIGILQQREAEEAMGAGERSSCNAGARNAES